VVVESDGGAAWWGEEDPEEALEDWPSIMAMREPGSERRSQARGRRAMGRRAPEADALLLLTGAALVVAATAGAWREAGARAAERICSVNE
jgi:anthranilate phosphoribosyltransferase